MDTILISDNWQAPDNLFGFYNISMRKETFLH